MLAEHPPRCVASGVLCIIAVGVGARSGGRRCARVCARFVWCLGVYTSFLCSVLGCAVRAGSWTWTGARSLALSL